MVNGTKETACGWDWLFSATQVNGLRFRGSFGSSFGDRSFVDYGIQEEKKWLAGYFHGPCLEKRSNGCGVKNSFAMRWCVVRQALFERGGRNNGHAKRG